MGGEAASIRSMTGQGHGTAEKGDAAVYAEVRSVNHRGLKIVARWPETLSPFESQFDALIRQSMHRGTVTVSMRVRTASGHAAPKINSRVLQSYIDQLQRVRDTSVDSSLTLELSNLLSLPGVMDDTSDTEADETTGEGSHPLRDLSLRALTIALQDLDRMRAIEGQQMVATLLEECDGIEQRLQNIHASSEDVVKRYAERLENRVNRFLEERGFDAATLDIIREVQIFADRSDISEEVTRMRGHLNQFRAVASGSDANAVHGVAKSAANRPTRTSGEPIGRKLDFIVQEMFRETNTTGSKAGDTSISAEVVEIKCALERIRELVQNLE